MKKGWGNSILTGVFISVILLLQSCHIEDFSKIKGVDIKTSTKVAIPLAYGTIKLQTLVDYLSPNDPMFEFNKEGYYSFEPRITEFEFHKTFSIRDSILDLLSSVEIRVETHNRLPLGVHLELIFIDSISSAEFGSPIECNLIEPATIDSSGKATEESHYIENISIPTESLSDYKKANALLVNIRFHLPFTTSDQISVNKEDYLLMNVGAVFETDLLGKLQ